MQGRFEGNAQQLAANQMARKYFLGEQFKLDQPLPAAASTSTR